MLGLVAMLLAGSTLPRPAQARGDAVELVSLQTMRSDGALTLEFVTQVILPRAVEDALQRGVPVYFMAQATLWRNRWYWRDERIARVSRTWRLAYQPLTSTWRVGLGGLNQNYPTLAEAMATVTRLSQWRLVDLSQIDPDSSYSIDFSWRLDTSQLPSPMLIGLIGGSEFSIGVERTLRLE
ncbi:MAG: DUF4390 domain-containing protein [Rubrivivax sp.]|nr:DUF4390 domain-containing protein [Rubrivivax sp.]